MSFFSFNYLVNLFLIKHKYKKHFSVTADDKLNGILVYYVKIMYNVAASMQLPFIQVKIYTHNQMQIEII